MDETKNGRSFVGDDPVAAEGAVLADRRELALVAVERTRMPMIITDPQQTDNPIVMANAAFLELTGYTAAEVIGRNCRFLQGPETDPDDVDAIREALASGAEHFELEVPNYRRDGSTFRNQLAVSRVTGEGGELLYYFASQKDVTALRKAERLEQAEHLLLKEVDHRAMNALALVQSFVSLGDAKDPESFSSAIRGHVQALASAHRLLAESRWRSVDLSALVAGSLPAVARRQVWTHGDPVRIQAQLVQPLALALHELTSNALRHGALSEPTGGLDVTWRRGGGGVVLEWHERCFRAVEAPMRSGVGLRMLDALATQLGAELRVDWQDGGIQVALAIPVPDEANP
ncbi:PAS domain-containing protein [uncultured Aureimonas sp.]|uniref:blue-light-activated histidine kinase n=1 Tax=uncultured Aureimonas sp. TaxID=1604662 RepID=UPI0025EC708D|nr:PAS domain-containing protein [uncultured Aureimonas sp.]